jgi:hypothetical protein
MYEHEGPQSRKGRRRAHFSAGMLVHSNQVGEGRKKLSKNLGSKDPSYSIGS